jgi:signal transduction histidine kinase
MSLHNEAAYLYVLAKKLTKVNKLIKQKTKKAQKHKNKHEKATKVNKREKHRIKHGKAAKEIGELMKDHNKLLAKIKKHQIAFAGQLQKEHKI